MTIHEPIAAAIARLGTPVFLAKQSAGRARPLISLYTTDRRASRQLARAAAESFAREGINADCRTVVARSSRLRRNSLEALVRGFGLGEIVYDPTGLITRSAAVVDCARRIRGASKAPLKGMYFNAERRTLFVILMQKAFPTGTEALLTKRVEAMAEIAQAVQAWRTECGPDFDLAIRIGFDLPTSIRVIPVDRQSVPSRLSRWQRLGVAAALSSALGLGAVASAQAADVGPGLPVYSAPVVQQPAVKNHNLDLLFAGVFLNGGGYHNQKIGAVGGKFAVPLGTSFGLQVDAAVGTLQYWGIGGHLFWRDPSEGLVGAFARHESLQGATLDRYGAEAELYLRNITLRGIVGMQAGDAPHDPFAGLDLTFYMQPNFSATAGAKLTDGALRGHAGIELQPNIGAMNGLSLFADGEWGDNNFAKVIAGVSLHFGSAGASSHRSRPQIRSGVRSVQLLDAGEHRLLGAIGRLSLSGRWRKYCLRGSWVPTSATWSRFLELLRKSKKTAMRPSSPF